MSYEFHNYYPQHQLKLGWSAFVQEQNQFGNSSPPAAAAVVPAPAPPPNPSTTIQSGDSQFAANQAAAQNAQKQAVTATTGVNQSQSILGTQSTSSDSTTKKAILGG